MTGMGLFGVLLLAGAAWYWFDAMRALESAREAGRARCEALGVRLLDDTVVLAGISLRRDEDGRLKIARRYRFEFSGDGFSRHYGEIQLLGPRIVTLDMDPWRA
ncbi:MAG: DUF3301 domain-containing protein [Gammaproteobacteria bacterium]|nr:DUF3301 domain-containing protein [Gammaproteobacteria bacterium]